MQNTLYCPNCNKSDGIKIFLKMNALVRAKVSELGVIKTCDSLEKLVCSENVFDFYASNDDETRIFLLKEKLDKEETVAAYCTKCSNTFQIKKEHLKNANAV